MLLEYCLFHLETNSVSLLLQTAWQQARALKPFHRTARIKQLKSVDHAAKVLLLFGRSAMPHSLEFEFDRITQITDPPVPILSSMKGGKDVLFSRKLGY
jgi:hypothetical protein